MYFPPKFIIIFKFFLMSIAVTAWRLSGVAAVDPSLAATSESPLMIFFIYLFFLMSIAATCRVAAIDPSSVATLRSCRC